MGENKNSKARIAANNRYNAKAYDELKIRVSKGNKDIIKAHAAAQGESINGYIKKSIDDRMKRDSSSENGTPTTE